MPVDTTSLPRGALADPIRARLYGPPIEALLGIQQLVPGRDVVPPPGEPCPHCGAIRDEQGKVLWPTGIQAGDPLACIFCQCLSPEDERGRGRQGKPPRDESKRPDRLCRPLTAQQRRAVARQGPVGIAWLLELEAQAAGEIDLAEKIRKLLRRRDAGAVKAEDFPARFDALMRKARARPRTRTWLVMREKLAAGDQERAGRLQTLLFRHRDKEIDDAELDRLAGTAPETAHVV